MQHSVRYKADGSRLINVQTVQRDSRGRERLILTEGGGRKITQGSSSGFQKRKKNWTGKEAAYQESGLESRAASAGAFSRFPPTQYRGQYSELFFRKKPWICFQAVLKTDVNFKF